MTKPIIFLADNGSKRAASVLNLRRLASELSDRSGCDVQAVSMQHADKIDPNELSGIPAVTLKGFLTHHLAASQRSFLLLPLFFGPTRALSSYAKDTFAELAPADAQLHYADVLCPLPQGEPRLTQILLDNIQAANAEPEHVVLVDHGSPLPAVTAVREHLGLQLKEGLNDSIQLHQSVMERRQSKKYDFNGELLEDTLTRLAADKADVTITLAMLFLSPGSHAGPGGDIETIVEKAQKQYPNAQLSISALVADHPKIIDILADRLAATNAISAESSD